MKLTRQTPRRLVAAATLAALATQAVGASSPAASACPDYFFLSGNLAANPDFEVPSADTAAGKPKCWVKGDPAMPGSAAAEWKMHTSNAGATICTYLLNGSAPGPGGSRFLYVRPLGNEGGVYQDLRLDPARAYMFSVWVYVAKGKVAIQSNGATGGPVAWTTKTGEWEQLRVCTNSQFSTNQLVIYNQDPAGGAFYVDRTELKEIPIRE